MRVKFMWILSIKVPLPLVLLHRILRRLRIRIRICICVYVLAWQMGQHNVMNTVFQNDSYKMKFRFLMREFMRTMYGWRKLYVIFMHTGNPLRRFGFSLSVQMQKPTLAHTKSIQEFYVSYKCKQLIYV